MTRGLRLLGSWGNGVLEEWGPRGMVSFQEGSVGASLLYA